MVASVSKHSKSVAQYNNNKFSHRRRKVGQASRVAVAVATIHKLIEEQEQSAKQMFDKTVAIGKELMRVKALVGHGQWGAWLRRNFQWSEDTAENYMRLARLVASGKIKIRIVRNLPLAAAYVLAGHTNLSQEFFNDLTRRVDAGERPTARQMKADIDRKERILEFETKNTRKILKSPYYLTKRSTAPPVPRSQLSRTVRSTQCNPTPAEPDDPPGPAEPDDPALQKVLDLIDMACAIDEIETPPTVAEIVAAVREQEIELTPSLARKLAGLFRALADELEHGPTPRDTRH
jgi:hypothetical protein